MLYRTYTTLNLGLPPCLSPVDIHTAKLFVSLVIYTVNVLFLVLLNIEHSRKFQFTGFDADLHTMDG